MLLAIRASISVRSDFLNGSPGVVIMLSFRSCRVSLRSPSSFWVRNVWGCCCAVVLGLLLLLACGGSCCTGIYSSSSG
jgi:hypothetical protein